MTTAVFNLLCLAPETCTYSDKVSVELPTFHAAVVQVAGTIFAVLGGLLAAALLQERRKLAAIRPKLLRDGYELVMRHRALGIDGLVFMAHWRRDIHPRLEALSDLGETEIRIPQPEWPRDEFGDVREIQIVMGVAREEEGALRRFAACAASMEALYRDSRNETALLHGPSRRRWDVHDRMDRLSLDVFWAIRGLPAESAWKRVFAPTHRKLDDQMGRIASFDALCAEAAASLETRMLWLTLLVMSLLGAGTLAPLWMAIETPQSVLLSGTLTLLVFVVLAFFALATAGLRRNLINQSAPEILRPQLAALD